MPNGEVTPLPMPIRMARLTLGPTTFMAGELRREGPVLSVAHEAERVDGEVRVSREMIRYKAVHEKDHGTLSQRERAERKKAGNASGGVRSGCARQSSVMSVRRRQESGMAHSKLCS